MDPLKKRMIIWILGTNTMGFCLGSSSICTVAKRNWNACKKYQSSKSVWNSMKKINLCAYFSSMESSNSQELSTKITHYPGKWRSKTRWRNSCQYIKLLRIFNNMSKYLSIQSENANKQMSQHHQHKNNFKSTSIGLASSIKTISIKNSSTFISSIWYSRKRKAIRTQPSG